MKMRLFTTAIACTVLLGGAALAQAPAKSGDKGGDKKAPAPKGPADLAFDQFDSARKEPGAKDQARFRKVIDAGMAYVATHPTHGRINDVVNQLANYGNSIDKKQAALITSYLSLLKLEVTNLKYKDGVSEPVKAALAAIEASIADNEVRSQFNRDNLVNLREKLDALNETPGTGRFLVERERSYVHVVAFGNTLAAAEAHLKKNLEHKDKGVAAMARTELNLVETKKAPYELKFTALDGKEVDFAQLRGKVVALFFWSSAHKGSIGRFDALRLVYSDYKKKGFEVVTVSFDKAEDVEKVKAAVKESRISFPVHFDGKGAKTDFAAKLNVNNPDQLLLFDQKGILQHTMQGTNLTVNLPVNQLEGHVKRMLGIK